MYVYIDMYVYIHVCIGMYRNIAYYVAEFLQEFAEWFWHVLANLCPKNGGPTTRTFLHVVDVCFCPWMTMSIQICFTGSR